MNVTVLFDEENQQQEIVLLKAWQLDHQFTYSGYAIKDDHSYTQPLNVDKTELFIIIIGESNRFLSAQFITDLKLIMNSTKAILCLNTNGFIGLNEDNCPRVLWDCGALHMPFDEENVRYSLNVIKPDTRIEHPTGSLHFRKDARPFDM